MVSFRKLPIIKVLLALLHYLARQAVTCARVLCVHVLLLCADNICLSQKMVRPNPMKRGRFCALVDGCTVHYGAFFKDACLISKIAKLLPQVMMAVVAA